MCMYTYVDLCMFVSPQKNMYIYIYTYIHVLYIIMYIYTPVLFQTYALLGEASSRASCKFGGTIVFMMFRGVLYSDFSMVPATHVFILALRSTLLHFVADPRW
jgi:hypothetical protein